MTFPVRGHSFLPPDRMFGVTEKEFRKLSEITPEEYHEIYRKVGTVNVLGNDWTIRTFKSLSNPLKKLNGITEMKRISLKKSKELGIG